MRFQAASGFTGAVVRTLLCAAIAAAAARAEAGAPSPAAAHPTLELSFRLDPRLTRSLYLGERWVSPPTFTAPGAPDGGSVAVRARVAVRDATGRPVRAAPEWSSARPEVASVSPRRGEEVEIVVRRPGQALVTVSHAGASRTLKVVTVPQRGGWRVEITPQPSAAATAPGAARARSL